jgi:hypothetical protein
MESLTLTMQEIEATVDHKKIRHYDFFAVLALVTTHSVGDGGLGAQGTFIGWDDAFLDAPESW